MIGYLVTQANIDSANAGQVIWQIGNPRSGTFEPGASFGFSAMSAAVHEVELESGRADPSRLPARIASDTKRGGVTELRLESLLAPGRYTLLLDILESIASNFCIVSLDDSEIGCFGVPYAGNIDAHGKTASQKIGYLENDVRELEAIGHRYEIGKRYEEPALRVFRFEIPFVCTEAGRHVLTISNHASWLNPQVQTFSGEGFAPVAYTLLNEFPVSHPTVSAEIPGRALVPIWGWMSMTSFDHPANRVTPPDELVRRSILESFKWGANNFEFLPVNADGMALDLGEELWEGREKYESSADKTWTSQEVRSLVRVAHEHGMLVEFFIYCLFGAGFIKHRMEFQEKVNMLEQIVANYGNALTTRAIDCVDGLITEAWFPVDGPRYTNAAWKSNPEFFLLASINDGAQYDIINAGYSPAMHHYAAHWPGGVAQHTGYDHSYPLLPYPREFYEKKEGTIYSYMQGCGQTGHLRKQFPLIGETSSGITNRTVSPDWILAQAHTFGVRKLVDPGDHLAMAMCWEADEETMAPPLARRYIYAASQDPVRLAAAGTLEDTGTGGEIDLKRNTRRLLKQDLTRVRKRHDYPATSTFIQNRHLQVLMLKDKEYNVLLCDLLGTASFYNHGPRVILAAPFCVTRFRDARFLEKNTEVIEAAGVKAVVEERSRMASGYVEITQNIRHTVYSDIAMVDVLIERAIAPGQSEEIDTVLALRGYDKLLGDEAALCQPTTIACFTLRDSTGVMPELILRLQSSNPARIRFEASTLRVTQRLEESHSIRVSLLGKVDEASPQTGDQFESMLNACELERAFDASGRIKLTNDSERDIVQCVKITNPDKAPYFVQEGGWWVFKGATPSQEFPGCDYVKLYSKAGTCSRIQRHGFIDGILRPGPGCQNLLAFRDIESEPAGASLLVELSAVHPMVPAPRLQTAELVKAVFLDDVEWRFFDGREVALPNRSGRYRLKMIWGEAVGPRILRCSATVSESRLEADQFTIALENPDWVRRNLHTPYTLVIDLGERNLVAVDGAAVRQQVGNRVLLECAPALEKWIVTAHLIPL